MQMFSNFAADLRVAARNLLNRPGFALLAVLTLSIGIALNVSVTAVLDAYLVRSLPYPGAERLYDIRFAAENQQPPRDLDKLDWSALSNVIEQPISWDLDMFYLTGDGRSESLPGAWVTPGFMAGLGIKTQLGRTFTPGEFKPGAPQVALISHSLWQGRFGGDPSIVGRRFPAYVSDRPDEAELFTIIGVLPSGFWHVNRFTQVLAPLRAPSHPYMVQLRAGVSPAQAADRIAQFVRGGIPNLPAGWRPRIVSTHGQYASRVRPILLIAAVAAGIVLLIACANVAFLLIVRAAGRQKEIAVRLALGASRRQIALMLAAEAMVIGTFATIGALGLVSLTLDSLAPILEQQLGRPVPGGSSAISLSGAGVLVAIVSLVLTMLFGLLPIVTTWSRDNSSGMRAGGCGVTTGTGAARLRRVLIALEMAGSLTLLAGSALMIRTTMNLLGTDLGFRGERVLTSPIGLRQRSYPDDASRLAFSDRLVSKMREIPGVSGAAISSGWALQPGSLRRFQVGGVDVEAAVRTVSPAYFDVLGTRLLAGRAFNTSDRVGSEPVAVISESLARGITPDPAQAVGRQLLLPESLGQNVSPRLIWRTVVGIAADVRQSARDENFLDLYLPVAQSPGRFLSIYLSTQGSPLDSVGPLQKALRELDGELSLNSVRSLQSGIDEEFSRPKFLSSLLAGLAIFAAALALLGVYGLVAFAVKQREREVAIRMAVGASPQSIVTLFLRQSVAVIIVGSVIGLVGAVLLGRALESQLHGVLPHDPLTLILAVAVIALAGLAAMVAPTRRAARTDPATLLRQD